MVKKAAAKKVTKKAGRKKSSSDLIDEQLARYRSMRDFKITAEPSGASTKAAKGKIETPGGLPFVIQKHAASHLHYDFRLGWNGVLKSWAVAKGPSYNVKDKRLAVQVEDHPMEYGGFEGIIPKGQYGGGTVMLWDAGTWEPQSLNPDVDGALKSGSLKFTMHGAKMKGNWALIRMGGKAANETKPNWLLIKEHDSFERGPDAACITEESPDSVVTKRSLDEIARNEDHVWNSKDTAKGKAWYRNESPAAAEPSEEPSKRQGTAKKAGVSKSAKRISSTIDLSKYPKESLPGFIPLQLAVQADQASDKPGWLHELKLDGYRIEARKRDDDVQLFTRSGLDWTHRMKEIAAAVAKLPVANAILDGEVVVLAENGTTNFANLQAAFQEGAKHTLTYFVFDLLHLDGHNLRNAELLERKKCLAQLLEANNDPESILRYSEHIETDGEKVFQHACDLDAEGIISKRAASRYTSGRTADWVKVKCIHDQEFVVGGFTLPSNGIHGVGALILGYYDGAGQFIYAGRTGTGFTQKSHRLIRDRLDKLTGKASPFDQLPKGVSRGVIWVKPELVAQVNFATWTSENLLRQAAFKGLREDKSPKEVRREESIEILPPSSKPKVTKTSAPRTASSRVTSKTATHKIAAKHAAVRLTHPDKIVDIESGLTKQQLADYYWAIAEHMLPQIAGRPLSLVRCPEGSTRPCFFQKHTSTTLPPGIETVNVPDKKTGKVEPYITLSTRESLAGLAQMGVLEVHPWGSRNDDLEHPDRIIIDLDPDESISWKTLTAAADETRKLLKNLGLESFLKSTGGKGLHLVVPLVPEHDWSVIKQFAHAIALQIEKQAPTQFLTKMSKAARKGKIFIDYLRNERGSTAVAAFSPRARAGAPVSVPLGWSELKGTERPSFHVADFDLWKSRLAHDPWIKLPTLKQRIDLDKVQQILG